MKKVSLRAFSAILMAFLIIIGLGVYVGRYIKDGEMWALYFDQSTSSSEYTLTDRNGTLLAKMGGGEKSYAENANTRIACYHVTGDYTGNVGTGALSSFKSKLSGFSLITGIEEQDDVNLQLTIDADLNLKAYEALNGRKGAVMVYNYKTGEVLCMVSSPSIDPLNPPETLPDGLLQQFFFHDGVVREIITGTDLTLRIDSPYSEYHTVTFRGARLKQEPPRVGAVWLYRELYRHKSGMGYEVHILFDAPAGPAHQGIRPSDLIDTKIICDEIEFA